MGDEMDEYEDLILTEEDLLILDTPLDRPLSRGDLIYGSDAYALDYRQRLGASTMSVTTFEPRPWQLDCALAAHLGRDVCVIAGTGYGKTLPFVMNCWLNPSLIVWIVSPLNSLGNQQAKTFQDWGIRAIAVNATTHYPGLHKVSLNRTHCINECFNIALISRTSLRANIKLLFRLLKPLPTQLASSLL
jgi:hypothetical protein